MTNLVRGLHDQIVRCKRLIERYEEIPTGGFALLMLRPAVERAEQALEEDDVVKIRITRKWIETTDMKKTKKAISYYPLFFFDSTIGKHSIIKKIPISAADALAEGGYTPDEYEAEFKKLNPKWPGVDRVGLEFVVVRV